MIIINFKHMAQQQLLIFSFNKNSYYCSRQQCTFSINQFSSLSEVKTPILQFNLFFSMKIKFKIPILLFGVLVWFFVQVVVFLRWLVGLVLIFLFKQIATTGINKGIFHLKDLVCALAFTSYCFPAQRQDAFGFTAKQNQTCLKRFYSLKDA